MNILIDGISKTYGQKIILDNLTLDVPSGSFYGIIGDNGAGKSTLFRIISGLEKPDRGNILYEGSSWNRKVAKEITYMNQVPLMMKASVYENIAYPLIIRQTEKKQIKKKVDELLEALDLFDLVHQSAKLLSGGEAQKVAFARAMIFEPSLLLMDEPTAHIDRKTIQLIEQLIRHRQEANHMTTLMITHNRDHQHNFFDEVFILSKGKLEQVQQAKKELL